MLRRPRGDGVVIRLDWYLFATANLSIGRSIFLRFRKWLASQRVRWSRTFSRFGAQIRSPRRNRRRSWRRFYNCASAGRIDTKRFERFIIEIATDLKAVANLVAPNCRRRVRIFFAVNFAVIKTLVLQRLLHILDGLIRPCSWRECGHQNHNCDPKFHIDVALTPKSVRYSVPAPVTASGSCWSFKTSR